jgi:hypothetical protein
MRRLAAAAAALFVLTAGFSAQAEGVNNLMAGINGLLTFPADPVLSFIEPPEAMEDMIGAPELPHFVGFFHGVLLGGYRAMTGAVDIVLFPFWVFPTLSPEARISIDPGAELEYE